MERDLVTFFNLERDESTKALSEVEISVNARNKKVALLHVPEEIFQEVLSKHGTEFSGSIISIKDPTPDPVSAQFRVSNLNQGVTVDSLIDFLGFGETRELCSVALSACKTFALVVVPYTMSSMITCCNGKELDGKSVAIDSSEKPHPKDQGMKDDAATEVSHNLQNPLVTLAHIAAASTVGTEEEPHEMGEEDYVKEYVTIDTTRSYNCYMIPTHAEVVRAISAQFPRSQDPYRTILRQRGRFEGIWHIETTNLDLYRNTQYLRYGSQEIGFMEVRKEIYRKNASGNFIRERVSKQRSQDSGDVPEKDENDLLITLFQANTERFSAVTDEMLLREIAIMDIGDLKKAPQPQRYKDTNELNGNKFFVLSNVTEEIAKEIPPHFPFFSPRYGWQRMYLNHRLRKRRCSFCGEEHETECPTKVLYAKLKAERKQMKEQARNNCFDIHMMGDSTLRYVEQEVMAVDVHAMSGATTGNILNAVDVNEEHRNVKNLIVVSGQNELQAQLTDEEFLLCLKRKEERLRVLATEKNIALVAPPRVKPLDPVDQAKEILFHTHLATLEEEIHNLKVWTNPICPFEEDGGMHPSPDQTSKLLHFLNAKASEDFGVSIFLASGPSELIATKRKYGGVKALYKYGCGACGDKSRNKWWNLCTTCEAAAKDPDSSGLRDAMNSLFARANEIRDLENPPLHNKAAYRERSPLRTDENATNESSHKTDEPNEEKKAYKRIKFCYEGK